MFLLKTIVGWAGSVVLGVASLFAASILTFTTTNTAILAIAAIVLGALFLNSQVNMLFKGKQASRSYNFVRVRPGLWELFFAIFTFGVFSALFVAFFFLVCLTTNDGSTINAAIFSVFLISVHLMSYIAGELFSSYTASKDRHTEGHGYVTPLQIIFLIILLSMAIFEGMVNSRITLSKHVFAIFAVGAFRRSFKSWIANILYVLLAIAILATFYSVNYNNQLDSFASMGLQFA